MVPEADFTTTLKAAASGQADAAKLISTQIYEQLRKLARARMRRVPPGDTLQPTALVNEAYMRLAAKQQPDWTCRRHFFAAAGQAMRDILVERARRKARPKHGGGRRRAELDVGELASEPSPEDVLAVEEVLQALEREHPRCAEIVVLRYYAGLGESQIALAMDVSERTIRRDWAFARSWLQRRLSSQAD